MIVWNLIILAVNLSLFIANRRHKYITPTKDGKGIIIKNKDGKPVVIFDKPLK